MQPAGARMPGRWPWRGALRGIALALCAAAVSCGFVGLLAMLAVEVDRVVVGACSVKRAGACGGGG